MSEVLRYAVRSGGAESREIACYKPDSKFYRWPGVEESWSWIQLGAERKRVWKNVSVPWKKEIDSLSALMMVSGWRR